MHELLAPAGSRDALEAAVNAGADAVYFGGNTHNARLAGNNFTEDALRDAVQYCHARHVKAYLTLNTLLTERELSQMPAHIAFLSTLGLDGVIVQDLGLANLFRRTVPDLPIHASTQMTVHTSHGLARAKELGFTRVVLAREAFDADMIRNSPVEIEVFIHGALCMCYSGQCYFSSMLAERSGNRGLCAQPCRHRYKNGYELSLHDLCLAAHMPSLLAQPIASLKIEGRLKSPEYVAGVVSVYRRLIDEKRSATTDELHFLKNLFSRQGFTDAYYTQGASEAMLGYRTEADKKRSASTIVKMPTPKTVPLSMSLSVSANAPTSLSVSDGVTAVTVNGEIPAAAKTRAITAADCEKQLTKLGGTPFVPTISVSVEPNLYLSAASLNALRRDALSAFTNAQTIPHTFYESSEAVNTLPQKTPKTYLMFQNESQIPQNPEADFIWLPLFSITDIKSEKIGAVLPTVFFDKEEPTVRKKLSALKKLGLTRVLCHTIGQSTLCRALGLIPYGGSGLNITNALAALEADVVEITASPELTLSQLKSMPKPIPTNVLIYGRHTLMTTENCLARNQKACTHGKNWYPLTDIKGNVFPTLCAYPHRNEILNAHPLYMADKLTLLRGANIHAYILRFTTETAAEVTEIMRLYHNELPFPGTYTRGAFFRSSASPAAKSKSI